MSFTKINISATINNTIDKVWQCWTEPQHIVNWNFASDDWCCPRANNDLRVSGKFSSRMEAKDGSFGFDFEGVYTEVNHYNTIAYTMSDDRNVKTTFDNQGSSVIVTTEFDAETTNPIEMQQAGWQAILNNFKSYTEKQG